MTNDARLSILNIPVATPLLVAWLAACWASNGQYVRRRSKASYRREALIHGYSRRRAAAARRSACDASHFVFYVCASSSRGKFAAGNRSIRAICACNYGPWPDIAMHLRVLTPLSGVHLAGGTAANIVLMTAERRGTSCSVFYFARASAKPYSMPASI